MKTDDQSPILCRLAGSLPALDIAGADQVPTDIQWMPPGKHTITATKSGKPTTLSVLVDAKGATRMQGVLEGYRTKAAAREGDVPYVDFNHAEAESAGSVAEFSWGGSDPVTGGIRARIDWSGPGRAALAGQAYRRFSPSFFIDAEGRVKGAPLVMGGLVNQAAFKTIAPIVSRDGGGSQEQEQNIMNEQELAALQAASAAKDAEITSLKATVAGLESSLALKAKQAAKAVVDAAIKAGKLPPQATELHAKWVEVITENPGLAETLDAIQATAAPGAVITNASAGGDGGKATDPDKARADKIMARAREIQATGVVFAKAYSQAIGEFVQ